MTLLATLFVGAIAAADTPLDRVDLGGNTVLLGRVLDCSSAGVRFLPESGNEVLLPPSAVKSVVLADGRICDPSAPPPEARPSRWGTGILAFLVLPVAATMIGGVVGGATCGDDETAVCAGFGSLIGLGTGLVLGTAVFVLSGRDAGPPARAAADPPRGRADPPRATPFSLSFHF